MSICGHSSWDAKWLFYKSNKLAFQIKVNLLNYKTFSIDSKLKFKSQCAVICELSKYYYQNRVDFNIENDFNQS
jgi:hypothetical protein